MSALRVTVVARSDLDKVDSAPTSAPGGGRQLRRRKSAAAIFELDGRSAREARQDKENALENEYHAARILSVKTVASSGMDGEESHEASDQTRMTGSADPRRKSRRSLSLGLVLETPGRETKEPLYLELKSPVVLTTEPVSPGVEEKPPSRSGLWGKLIGAYSRIRRTVAWIFARRKLYSYEELPAWLRAANTSFIKRGYQANLSGYREAWAMAVSSLTNETVNIWTHLIGAFVFIALGARCFSYLHPAASFYDRLIFGSYCALATKSLFSSALFHAHFHLSPKAYKMWCSWDTVGISALTCGSGTLLAYYIFHGQQPLQAIWLAVVVLINLIGMVGPAFEFWTSPHLRTTRVFVYSASGLLSVMPAFYVFLAGVPESWPKSATSWIAGSFASYILGTLVYLTQIPERWAPGLFDYVFASHQLWHGFVFAGAYTMFRAGYDLMKWRLMCA